MQMPHSAYARARLWGLKSLIVVRFLILVVRGTRARARTHANHQRELARAYWGKSPQIQQNSACTTEEKL